MGNFRGSFVFDITIPVLRLTVARIRALQLCVVITTPILTIFRGSRVWVSRSLLTRVSWPVLKKLVRCPPGPPLLTPKQGEPTFSFMVETIFILFVPVIVVVRPVLET